ncbi:ABC transporter ATP-binding protein [Endozoicomonas acroporae]|uniref:ABC transporter ATP-binding protein n=1 Tax=Endozoicomonas TaxID=305899 RepID=UPI000C755D37|nr:MULTISPECIES: oligopeptide/dipeptide ABC transporter ATP-binding protein [Endozoicomonas]WBA80695.1 ATP-binding cassette domain-containing protein [Endozoicomonas sp. GU-1]WBA88261.1 ATP-binding cassette domain-containing protein [Endozoicomonas sp. GU-1]
MNENSIILEVKNLNTRFDTPDGEVAAANEISFTLKKGESLGVVGESGSGKTQIFMALMGLLAKNGKTTGEAIFKGQNILGLPVKELNKVRGVSLSMIFQDPMTSLNPYLKVSRQMTEVLIEHQGMSQKKALERSIEMLELVGIPEARKRVHMYPHEFSGGMRQRVMIAIALLCEPDLLIADEPTTALDVTIQAQILDLLHDLKDKLGMSIVMITHDLGVIASMCDHVMVMYGGRVVETGSVQALFSDAKHPYTRGLLQSMPRIDGDHNEDLYAIPGQPPNLQALPQGCAFQPRCQYATNLCQQERPQTTEFDAGRTASCHQLSSAFHASSPVKNNPVNVVEGVL